ncbi:leucine rich repeat (LRR) protein [Limnobacter thiooxidans]|uniref:Disease resistance R13L4/SHOC-2-like LRR domain-containing protein n=2 Tax=Limnobacter TaxID=131079 RepID=A0AA86IZN4_9BURK|nr:leucine rich repeat (LRR) protein [Limnobacter thiooxidans]BET25058.1 hypothetical protein RGQ30_05590 [Limnobacter thiooxidans]
MHTQRSGANAHQALSFDHAETRRTQAGAQLAHVPISPAQLEYQLNTWATKGAKYERRNEAKQRILEAHRTGADRLDLNELFLSTLPENIGALTNLQTLNLNVNQLTTLPKSIGNLTKLKTLNLGCNPLTTLPEDIGKLTGLKEFSISKNPPLKYLPSALAEFQRQHGDLKELPLLDSVPSQASQSVSDISPDELKLSQTLLNLPPTLDTLIKLKKIASTPGGQLHALVPNGGSSQGKASSPPRVVSPNTGMAGNYVGLAELKQQLADLQGNMKAVVAKAEAQASAAITLYQAAIRTVNEAKQQLSLHGMSTRLEPQAMRILWRKVLNHNKYETQAVRGIIGRKPEVTDLSQLPNIASTLAERAVTLKGALSDLGTPLSASEFGRVVTAYLKEHGRLHSDGTVDLNKKLWVWKNKLVGLKNRQLLKKLKEIHNTENRGGDYKLGIELFALLKKMPNAAHLNPWIPRNTMKLQQLIDAEKIEWVK